MGTNFDWEVNILIGQVSSAICEEVILIVAVSMVVIGGNYWGSY